MNKEMDSTKPSLRQYLNIFTERKWKARRIRPIVVAGALALSLIAFALVLPDSAQSQAPPPPPSKPQQTPIDGGLGLLAAAGGAYAVKKLRDKRKE